jgi:outer membrane protein OmpA-like peptidoglycan-associated protein
MPSSVLFDTDSTALTAGSRDRLNQVSDILNRYPRTRIVVEGHTDSVGSNSYNFRLSEHRAESVSDYLVDQGVERFRITTIGYGENRPIASNATPEGRLQNRRVELKIRVDRSRFQTRDLEERRSERPRY